jgi:hypothetical protein
MFHKWLDDDSIRIIGEKTPDNINYIPLLAALFPNSKFIHIIRDPRDSAVSHWHFAISGIDENKQVATKINKHVLNYGQLWCELTVKGRETGMEIGDRYLEIFYESLNRSTLAELRKVLAFLGASTHADAVDRCVSRNTFEALTGGRKSGDADNDRFFRSGISGDWKNHLSQSLWDQFMKENQETMKRFGYTT